MTQKRSKMVFGKFDAVCVVCGTVTEVNFAQLKRRIYCSKACRWKVERGDDSIFSKPKIERVCKACNKIFYVQPYIVKDGEGIYCSRECANVGFSLYHSGENAPNWQGGQVELTCVICGKPYKTDRHRADTSKTCSWDCQHVWQGQCITGPNHPFWRGGCDSWGYTKEFSNEFKAYIRQRDGYMCAVCGIEEELIAFDVHHIDYDKKNSIPENCITLCKSCHTKTTMGDRNQWIQQLSVISNEREVYMY